MNVASGARQLLNWAVITGPGPVLGLVGAIVVALIGGAFLLINGSRQRRHDSVAEVNRASRENHAAPRERLVPAVRELIQVCGDLDALASHLTNDPPAGVGEAPQAIRDARRRIDRVLEDELRGTKHELIAINGRIVQWYGIKRGLLDDAAAGRGSNPQLGRRVDELEVEVPARLTAVRTALETALDELNR